MKKAIYLLMMCAGVLLTACEKDAIGSTATKALAGEWNVSVDGADANGAVIDKDVLGIGRKVINTYNTAANIPTEMYMDDLGKIWQYKVRVKSDVNALTFSTEGAVTNEYYDCKVTIESGKILLGAAMTPHGTPADSIVCYVTFSDDDHIPETYVKLKISGYRYTGLAMDN